MENSDYSYEERPRRKNSKGLVIVLLSIGVLIGLVFGFANNSSHNTTQQTQQTQIAKVSDERGQLQKNFDDALARLDSMTGISHKTQEMISGREKDITKMELQIRSILRKQHLTEGEKKKAEAMIADLNTKISGMQEQVAKLTQDNQTLTQDNTDLKQGNDKLTSDLQTTNTTNEDLSKKVDVASTLVADNIKVVPVHDKKNGEEKETTKAKKVSKLNVSFDVTNRIAATGQTDVYVCVTGPDGKIISVPASGSGTFTTREEGDKAFTSKVAVDFEAGKSKNVQFSWKQDGGFQTGIYKIEIYHNGFKIGEKSTELKKGGLFS
ncbi:MAG TPA: hypothetical protein VKR32_17515 [Puia sp.]|nr:hypothetical protein [Puia sp.]